MIDLGLDRKVEFAIFGAPVDVIPPIGASNVAVLEKTMLQADTPKDPWREIARTTGWESTWKIPLHERDLTVRFTDVDWDAEVVEHFAVIGAFSFAVIQFGKCFYARHARIIECNSDKHGLSNLTISVRGDCSLR